MSDKEPISIEDLLKLANPQGLIGYVTGGGDGPTLNQAQREGLIKFTGSIRRIDTNRIHETYEITARGRERLASLQPKGRVHDAGIGESAPIRDKT